MLTLMECKLEYRTQVTQVNYYLPKAMTSYADMMINDIFETMAPSSFNRPWSSSCKPSKRLCILEA
jgi:hypothetical protein